MLGIELGRQVLCLRAPGRTAAQLPLHLIPMVPARPALQPHLSITMAPC